MALGPLGLIDLAHPPLTLAEPIIDMAESYLRVPSGVGANAPLRLTDEQVEVLWAWYSVTPNGRRYVHNRKLILRMAKGWAKSPIGAVIMFAGLVGDVIPDGLDAAGRPVGRPHPRPWLQVAANALDQTANLYKQFVDMVAEGGAVDDFYLDLGVTRTTTRSGGLIEPVTSEAGTREGQPISGAALEEALDIDTPLPTPSGWTTMGEVQIGDELIGAHGEPVAIVKVTDVVTREAYRVTFEDGSTVIASAGHLWLTRVAGRSDRPAKVRTTHELVSGGQRYRVPARAGIEGKAVDLDIDPYVLGCWLGDGDSRNATITGSEADLAEIELNIQAAGYTTRRLSTRDRSPAIYVSVPGSTRNRFSKERGLKVRLAQAGLLGNKHIPAEYLRTSRSQREALLAGLMDSDGHVTRRGHCCFANQSKALIDGFVELLASLGEIGHVVWNVDPQSRIGGCWKVHFTPRTCQPFRLARKLARVHVMSERISQWVSITSIEPVGQRHVRCVAVDSEDHLFLAGHGWHVTHNTHLYRPSNGGVAMADTIYRNATKFNARVIELTNAYVPGAGSTAQRSEEAVAKGRGSGVLLVSREADAPVDDEQMRDAVWVRRQLDGVYGSASTDRGGWVDLDRITQDIVEAPDDRLAQQRRFFFNQVVAPEEHALDLVRWASLGNADALLAEGDVIALGFDGSDSADATALYACRWPDWCVFELAVWERPVDTDGQPIRGQWRVPRAEVVARVRWACETFTVVRGYADDSGWQSEIDTLNGEFGAAFMRFPHRQDQRIGPACERWSTMIDEGTLRHDGRPTLARHAANARKVPIGRQGAHWWRPARRLENIPIDSLSAAISAVHALGDAVAAGEVGQEPEMSEPMFRFTQ